LKPKTWLHPLDVSDSSPRSSGTEWTDGVFTLLKANRINVASFVPDGAHLRLIQRDRNFDRTHESMARG